MRNGDSRFSQLHLALTEMKKELDTTLQQLRMKDEELTQIDIQNAELRNQNYDQSLQVPRQFYSFTSHLHQIFSIR